MLFKIVHAVIGYFYIQYMVAGIGGARYVLFLGAVLNVAVGYLLYTVL